MRDSNWELINGDTAHEIEILNYAVQVNVIEAVFKSMAYHHGIGSDGCPSPLTADVLRELHRAGTLFLLKKPGEYRDEDVRITRPDGTLVYQPPRFFEVPSLVGLFEKQLGERWLSNSPLDLASFCLWRINWIHPFKNGNGRSARAFSYACLCLRHGFIIPGDPTLLDLIMKNRPEYYRHLAWGDRTFADSGTADLAPMKSFLDNLLTEQLKSVATDQQVIRS
jgi:Fic family protein